MGRRIDDTALDTLFSEARTYAKWQPRPVAEETLRNLYDLLKWAPTSANAAPARFAFLQSQAAKERLRPALAPLNIGKTMSAPVTVIVAYDLRFYENLPSTFPHRPEANKAFMGDDKLAHAERTALRNSSLQGAYVIIAARALGLDCGPMSGFDNAKVDAAFFPDGRWKSNFLCNLGRGDPAKVAPRNPRLTFDQACRIV